MPLVQIYTCGLCERSRRVPHGAPAPTCCASRMRWRQTREYKPEEHGWDTGMRSAAVGFRHTNPWMVPLGDSGPMPVESLRQVRHIERESEKMAADGVEGAQELRFRAFANDTEGGGLQRNTFGEPPHQRKPQLYDKQGRQRISIAPVDADTADADQMGPGADASLASALPESPL